MQTNYPTTNTIKNILRALKTQQFKKSNWKMGNDTTLIIPKRIYGKNIQLSGQQKLKTTLRYHHFLIKMNTIFKIMVAPNW